MKDEEIKKEIIKILKDEYGLNYNQREKKRLAEFRDKDSIVDLAIRKTREADEKELEQKRKEINEFAEKKLSQKNSEVEELQSKINESDKIISEMVRENEYKFRKIKELENDRESSRLAIAEFYKDLKKIKKSKTDMLRDMIIQLSPRHHKRCSCHICSEIKQQLKRLGK